METTRSVDKKSPNRVQVVKAARFHPAATVRRTGAKGGGHTMKLRVIQLAIVLVTAVAFAATNGSGPWP
jgi:hypothetical protein